MKKIITTFLLSGLLGLSLTAQENKTIVELDNFNEIKAFDRVNVTLVKSDKNSAVISGDNQDEVKLVNKDGLLKIQMEIENFLAGNETFVTIYYTNNLSLLDANEGAVIKTDGELTAPYLTLRSQEGGEVHAVVSTRNLNTKAVTGGKIKVTGSATNQEINIRSGGDFDGKKLAASQTDVTVFAGGTAIVNSDEFVDANVTAGGTIEIYGNPETVKEDKTLGGQIVVR
ncbi:DUF2807 domain-containing protein [Flavobacteriaceae bacterium TP-CH-4]|uniref:DUF2807 domain-containing protein n=1 Tax=Pelagihabitans pacificus TaxID=2696054 RepID=A0A967B2T9_9FLAO|nr:head GIN domain-containing protein [Pelagihabitans pacificus]NHF61001.1 DUF2807 domain-containing protein [Pelagihabitans pacificus]